MANHIKDDLLTRRAALVRAGLLVNTAAVALADEKPSDTKLKVSVFSKHLQFVKGEALAKAAAEIGFDGIDLTVRKGGHIDPARVAQDLPPLVKIIRDHELTVPMITTDIADADTPYTEKILKTMASLGIRNYRWGGLKYVADRPFAAQLDAMKPRIARLAALNSRYGACAMYHTHSGTGVVGAPIWDLYILLRDFDASAVGVNYDVAHATIEGGAGGWIDSFRITEPYLRGIAIKDFLWNKDEKGVWQAQWRPLGEGMVRFPEFFRMLAKARFSGPVQVHFEYPMSDAEAPALMKRDLITLRGYLSRASL